MSPCTLSRIPINKKLTQVSDVAPGFLIFVPLGFRIPLLGFGKPITYVFIML
jgi:hypothetical protein